jgi:hypothetical protein
LADIIAFPAARITGTPHGTPEQKCPADILFFTGVRIERHAEEHTAAKPVTKRPAPSPERSTPRRRRN